MHYIFIGPAGSGKTSLAERFCSEKNLVFYDILRVMLPYVKEHGSVTEKNKDVLDCVVSDFVATFEEEAFDVLEFATGGYLEQILSSLNGNVSVVYCSCPLDVSLERNRSRERQVPEHYIKYQSQFGLAYYQALQERCSFRLLFE